MELQEYFEEKYWDFYYQMKEAPHLKGIFFLVYESSEGKFNEFMKKSRISVEEEMRQELKKKGLDSVNYMCRRIGLEHYLDDKVPRK